MIERYSIHASSKQLTERFSLESAGGYKPTYNAAPSHLLPVIMHENPVGLSFFYWGMAPQWTQNKSMAERIINTRAELISEKPVLKKTLMKNRCLIPADGFYCWKKVGKKTSIPWRFTAKNREILSFAGLWEEYEDENGKAFHTFSIITTPSSETVADVTERMPLIFTQNEEQVWLQKEATAEQLIALFKSFPSSQLEGYTVSPAINSIEKDVPSLILPTPPADQFGNLTLFS